jgi:hypothetical protein
MPDERTVYFGHDGTDRVLSKFVANEAGDLSAGTLYAAKVTQTGDPNGEYTFELEWIELGSATNDEIYTAIRELDEPSAAMMAETMGRQVVSDE